jgi:hypothetical protein
MAYINWGTYIWGRAYIWNEVSVSTCGGLIHGGLIVGGYGIPILCDNIAMLPATEHRI